MKVTRDAWDSLAMATKSPEGRIAAMFQYVLRSQSKWNTRVLTGDVPERPGLQLHRTTPPAWSVVISAGSRGTAA